MSELEIVLTVECHNCKRKTKVDNIGDAFYTKIFGNGKEGTIIFMCRSCKQSNSINIWDN